jgi:hypothetical protein
VIEGFRLSPQQRRQWAFSREGFSRHVQGVLLIEGPLDASALRAALEALVQTHEILRTVYPCLGGMEVPVQAIASQMGVAYRELDQLRSDTPLVAAPWRQVWDEDGHEPFNLNEGPILRASLVRSGSTAHVLVLTVPAVAADEHSMLQMLDTLAARLVTPDVLVHETPVQYADFAEWQNAVVAEPDADTHWSAWKEWRLERLMVPGWSAARTCGTNPVQSYRRAVLGQTVLDSGVASSRARLRARPGWSACPACRGARTSLWAAARTAVDCRDWIAQSVCLRATSRCAWH